MNRNLKRSLISIAGVIFIILGLIGLVLPFLQGILFLAIGVILLSIVSPSVRDWAERTTRRWPSLHEFVQKVQKKVTNFIGEEGSGEKPTE